jgi:hypothetical protein
LLGHLLVDRRQILIDWRQFWLNHDCGPPGCCRHLPACWLLSQLDGVGLLALGLGIVVDDVMAARTRDGRQMLEVAMIPGDYGRLHYFNPRWLPSHLAVACPTRG